MATHNSSSPRMYKTSGAASDDEISSEALMGSTGFLSLVS